MLFKNMFYRVVFFLLMVAYWSTIPAQISIGFNFEPFVLNGDLPTRGISLLGISATIAYQIDSTKSISLRVGLYSRDGDARYFAGSNYSLLGRWNFNNSLYGISGISLYNNDATHSMSTSITNHSFVLLNVGIGLKPVTWFHFENIILIPVGNREFATVKSYGIYTDSYKADYLLKLNFCFEFEL